MIPSASPAGPPAECDVAIVGGGILGQAVARELLARRPGAELHLFEGEDRIGRHQTGRSSGVIHAGLYYEPGSLKAQLCVEGARELYAYCDEHSIPYRKTGKLVIAADETELGRLDELERRGRENGVPELRRIDAAEIAAIEPHARGVAALHSPHTGVADFVAVASSYAADVAAAGGAVHFNTRVRGARPSADGSAVAIEHSRGTTVAKSAVFCAGLWSDRLAVACGAPADPRIVPFRGGYLRLPPEAAKLIRGNVYPVPAPELPFLGAHLTRTMADEVLVGPTALMAPARDAYELHQLRARDLGETLAWPGTWRLLRGHWRAALKEAGRRSAVAPT